MDVVPTEAVEIPIEATAGAVVEVPSQIASRTTNGKHKMHQQDLIHNIRLEETLT